MAKDKKSIVVYADWISIFDKLTDEEAGRLIKHFFAYVNDHDPAAPDRLIDIVFEPIKQQLKRDLRKYEAMCLRNRNNGEKGGRPKNNPKKPSGLKNNPKNPTEPDNDNDNDNDNDIIVSNQKNNLQKRETEFRQLVFESNPLKYSQYMLENFCRYWTEPNRSNTKMRFELEKVFDITRRLATWASRDKEIGKKNGSSIPEMQNAPQYNRRLREA